MAAKQLLQGPGSIAYRIGQGVGGIDADFVSAMPPDYECPICHLAYRDPVQTRDCGHRFCETCIEPILRKTPAFCPIDRRPLTRDKLYPDKACKRTILSLLVRCYNYGNDCTWTGELANLQDHLEPCQKVPITCINECGRTDIPRSQRRMDALSREIGKDNCLELARPNNGVYVLEDDIASRISSVFGLLDLRMKGKSICKSDVESQSQNDCTSTMSAHIDADGDCPLAVVPCKYNDFGCKYKGRRVDMESHLAETMQQHLDLAHVRIKELEVRQENICMNGKFLWKISNYSQLSQQAQTKKEKEKLCSPPFYTGQYGYKLRAEAFLCGLGQGKGSHLSLYVVIMKGEYDAILPWPFQQRVDFTLIDQDDDPNNRQNKVWRLSCDRNSDYFKRPNRSKSLGFGCPKFVSLDTLRTARNYVKDDTIFIKIEVEPTETLV